MNTNRKSAGRCKRPLTKKVGYWFFWASTVGLGACSNHQAAPVSQASPAQSPAAVALDLSNIKQINGEVLDSMQAYGSARLVSEIAAKLPSVRDDIAKTESYYLALRHGNGQSERLGVQIFLQGLRKERSIQEISIQALQMVGPDYKEEIVNAFKELFEDPTTSTKTKRMLLHGFYELRSPFAMVMNDILVDILKGNNLELGRDDSLLRTASETLIRTNGVEYVESLYEYIPDDGKRALLYGIIMHSSATAGSLNTTQESRKRLRAIVMRDLDSNDVPLRRTAIYSLVYILGPDAYETTDAQRRINLPVRQRLEKQFATEGDSATREYLGELLDLWLRDGTLTRLHQ